MLRPYIASVYGLAVFFRERTWTIPYNVAARENNVGATQCGRPRFFSVFNCKTALLRPFT